MKKRFTGFMNFNADGSPALVLDLNVSGVVLNNVEHTKDYYNGFESKKDWLKYQINNTFNPDTTPQALIPKEEDFVQKPFRLISATTVGAGTWKSTDFSDTRILRGSRNMLEGVPVYKEHRMNLDNWMGIVTGVKWTSAFTSNGVNIPAGIDGIIAVDAKTNPKIARGLLMGTIFSNSVTVEFEWEMSHEFENDWDFYNRIGEIGKDGKMIRRVVTNIINYHETSLVWLGADPYAKAIDTSGDLVNVDIGSIYELSKLSYTKERQLPNTQERPEYKQFNKQKKYVINFGIDENVLTLAHRKTSNQVSHIKNTDMDKAFVIAFVKKFGMMLNIPADTVTMTVEDMIKHLAKINLPDAAKTTALLAKGKVADSFTQVALKALGDETKEESFKADDFLSNYEFVSKEKFAKLTTDAAKVEQLTKENAELTAAQAKNAASSALSWKSVLRIQRGADRFLP